MAGRGRGRGGLNQYANQDLKDLVKDYLPPDVKPLPPTFPALHFKPLPLRESPDLDYEVSLKQEYRGTMQSLPTFITEDKKSDFVRYKDRLNNSKTQDKLMELIDWNRLPKELHFTRKRKRFKAKPSTIDVPVEEKLKALEEKENSKDEETEDEKEVAEKDKDDDDDELVEGGDDEDFEEDNDYVDTYFDNGEGYLDEENGGGDADDYYD